MYETVVRTNAINQKIDKRVYEAKAFDNASGGTGIDLIEISLYVATSR